MNLADNKIINKFNIVIFIALFLAMNTGINLRILWWVIVSVILVLTIMNLSKKNNSFTLWISLFAIVIFLSTIYSINTDSSFDYFIQYLPQLVILIYLNQSIKTHRSIQNFIIIFVLNALLITLYVVFDYGLENFGIMRLGDHNIEKWNSNYIGLITAISSLLSVYLYYATGKKTRILPIISVFFILITLLTGSRKAFILIVLVLGLTLIFHHKNKILIRTGIVLLVTTLVIIIILNNDILYNVLGERIIELYKTVLGIETTDYSYIYRINYLTKGYDYFMSRPLQGYGINSFSTLYFNEYGINVYSHNNYIELLVSFGLIGFVIYYSMYLIIIHKLIQKINTTSFMRFKYVFILSLLITLLIIEFSLVSYNLFFIQLLLLISFKIAFIKE